MIPIATLATIGLRTVDVISNAQMFCQTQELLSTLEEQKADLEVVEMSGPPRVEQAVDLAEELATVSQKYEFNVNKLKRQKVWFLKHVSALCFTYVRCN